MFEQSGERFTLVAVVAMAKNRVIGQDGAMPWTLRSDLKRYRALTTGRPMIMGRKTLVSIGRALDGRDTIVLTRTNAQPVEGALVASDVGQALDLAARCARARGVNEIAIVGGAQIYALFLGLTDRIELTQVQAEPEGDTFFPALEEGEWSFGPATAMERGPKDTAEARFITIERRTTV